MMNERIRELAELAAFEVRAKHNNAYWTMQNDLAEDKTWREKYALLIIHECLKIMGTNISGTFDSDWDFDTQVKYVKKHFGIDDQQDEIKFCPLCGEEWSGTSCGLDDCGWILNERKN